MNIRVGFAALCLLAACATSYVPRTNSREDLQTYVERAAQVVRERGADACAAFATPRWMAGDYYIFVNDAETSVAVCHPVRPDLVGKSQDAMQDANGKFVVREMLAVAATPAGRGWVEYMWPRPGQTTPVPKKAFVIAVTGPDGARYLVGSGAYGL